MIRARLGAERTLGANKFLESSQLLFICKAIKLRSGFAKLSPTEAKLSSQPKHSQVKLSQFTSFSPQCCTNPLAVKRSGKPTNFLRSLSLT